jgi:hypothetical protein
MGDADGLLLSVHYVETRVDIIFSMGGLYVKLILALCLRPISI